MKIGRKTAALAILLMAIALAGPILADPGTGSTSVPTSATVTGAGVAPPHFKGKWELPDDDNATPGCQVMPVPYGNKQVTTYMVVNDSQGASVISLVYIAVINPNGTIKYFEIDATEFSPDTNIFPYIDAGVNESCLTMAQATDMKTELSEGEARAYYASFNMTYQQVSGNYTVIAYATDVYGNIGSYSNTFTYLSLEYLSIDFGAGVSFGTIIPGYEQIVSGDADMTTPGKPTVQSGGNDNITIGVNFSPMVGAAHGKTITTFDSVFLLQRINCTAGTTYYFANPLQPCTTAKIDFSVDPPFGLAVDTYAGNVTISVNPYP